MRRFTIPMTLIALAACDMPVPDMRPSAPVAAAPAAIEAPAPVATPMSAKERFVSAAVANGCVVNESNSATILAGATLSVEDLARIMSELKAEGRGEIAADGRSFRITSDGCTA